MKNIIYEKIDKGDLSLGMITFGTDPNWLEILAYIGFDHIKIDMMLTPIDWNDARHLVNAAHASGINAIIRLQSNPWIKDNPTLGQDALRALAIGADGVYVSVNSSKEVEELLEVKRDWHRKMHLFPYLLDDHEEIKNQLIEETIVFPLIESEHALDNIEEIMSIPELKIVGIGVGDISRILGVPFDFNNDKVWAVINDIVQMGKKYGVHISTNTGYDRSSLEQTANRIKNLHDHGINIITVQSPEFFLQMTLRELKARIKAKVPCSFSKNLRT
jgi:2-keto-3-deoxy-L-rhamnonate aldolase RhmA